MKTAITIPLVHTGKIPEAWLPDDHPDLKGPRALARDAGIPLDEAQTILDILFNAYDHRRRLEGR